MKTKEELRTRLDEIDSQIFDLVRVRLDASREIAEVKYASGEGICDPTREEELIEQRVRCYSDLPPRAVRRVQGALIQSGKEVQYLRRRELVYSGSKGSVRD